MAKRKVIAPALPYSHLETMDTYGFSAVTYQNRAIRTLCEDGTERNEWLPEDLVNWEKRQLVRYRKANDGAYSFDGWEPTAEGQFGGRYRTVQGALTWFTWLETQKERFS